MFPLSGKQERRRSQAGVSRLSAAESALSSIRPSWWGETHSPWGAPLLSSSRNPHARAPCGLSSRPMKSTVTNLPLTAFIHVSNVRILFGSAWFTPWADRCGSETRRRPRLRPQEAGGPRGRVLTKSVGAAPGETARRPEAAGEAPRDKGVPARVVPWLIRDVLHTA